MNRRRLDAETIRDSRAAASRQARSDDGRASVKQFVESPGIHVTPTVDYQSFDVDSPGNYRRSFTAFCFARCPTRSWNRWIAPTARSSRPTRSTSVTRIAGAVAAEQSLRRAAKRAHGRALTQAGADAAASRFACCFNRSCCDDPTAEESQRWAGICRATRTGQCLPDDVQHQ